MRWQAEWHLQMMGSFAGNHGDKHSAEDMSAAVCEIHTEKSEGF